VLTLEDGYESDSSHDELVEKDWHTQMIEDMDRAAGQAEEDREAEDFAEILAHHHEIQEIQAEFMDAAVSLPFYEGILDDDESSYRELTTTEEAEVDAFVQQADPEQEARDEFELIFAEISKLNDQLERDLQLLQPKKASVDQWTESLKTLWKTSDSAVMAEMMINDEASRRLLKIEEERRELESAHVENMAPIRAKLERNPYYQQLQRNLDEYRHDQEVCVQEEWDRVLEEAQRAAERLVQEVCWYEQQEELQQWEQDLHEKAERDRIADADRASFERKAKLDSNPKFKVSAKESELARAKKKEWFDAGYSSSRIKKMLVKEKITTPQRNRKEKLETTLADRPDKAVTKYRAVKEALQSSGLWLYQGKVYDIYEPGKDEEMEEEAAIGSSLKQR